MTQITANFMEKNIATNFSVVTVLASGGLTQKHFGHYAILKIFSFTSPSTLWHGDHDLSGNHSHLVPIESEVAQLM